MFERGFNNRGLSISYAVDDDSDYDDFDLYDGEIDLVNDLDGATPSNATSGQLQPIAPVTLSTIHDDIQLLTVTVLMIYVIVFVLFIIRKWR